MAASRTKTLLDPLFESNPIALHLHFVELVVEISEVITGAAAARDVPVVVILSSWVGISAKSRAHVQFIHACVSR